MTQTTFTLPVGPHEPAHSGLSPPRPNPTPADDDRLRAGAPDGELWSPERALPEDTLAETVALLDAQVAALRARLSAVEEVVGLPVRPGRPAPPTLPELRRRLATLERRAGIVPGLAPLPGLAPAVTPEPEPPAPAARGRAAWLARGREAAVVAVLLAVVVLLARPTGESRRAATPAGVRPTAPATARPGSEATADGPQRVSAAPAAPPASGQLPGESPCALGGTAPCGLASTGGRWSGPPCDQPPLAEDWCLTGTPYPAGYRVSPPNELEPAEPAVAGTPAGPGFIGPLREIHQNDEAPTLRGAPTDNWSAASTQPECAAMACVGPLP